MASMGRRRRGSRGTATAPKAACASLLVCLVLPFILPALTAFAIVSTSITVDGDLSDWTGVRADPQNASQDTQISDPDPDYPGQPDRDVYLINATWDDDYLYLAFRRTSGGTKAITYGAYIDRDGDGLLQDNDVCVAWTVSQSPTGRFADAHAPSPTAYIMNYHQATVGTGGPYLYPAGDPMGHDGDTPDGWCNLQNGQIYPVEPMDGWMAANGIEFEGRVAWSDLGLAPGSPIAMHFVCGNGTTWGKEGTPSNTWKLIGSPPQLVEENRGQIEDNVNDIWWLRLVEVEVSPDNAGGGSAGETIVYSHTVTSSSNTTDTFDLTAISSNGWPVTVTDTYGNPVSAVTLGPGESLPIQVSVTIPNGTPEGVRDTTAVTATSQLDPTASDTAYDVTSVGRVTVTPDQSGTMAPGQTAAYTFTVANNMSGNRTFDLTGLSSMGWPYTITDALGNPLSSVTLASGSSVDVVVHVSVPATATIGSKDVTRLNATLQGNTSIRAYATAETTVRAELTITPNNEGYGGAGAAVLYSHTVTNSWPTTRTIALSATSSQGWPVAFYAADGVTPITSVTLGPTGDSEQFYARVSVPTGTAANTVDVTTVTATTGTTTATATDRTTVRTLATYADGGYLFPSSDFDLTDIAHARATGLPAGDLVRFVWKDPTGAIMRTSPLRTVDTMGMAFDDYTSSLTDATGDWTLELLDNKGNLLETQVIRFHWKGEITALSATDAPEVAQNVAITSSVRNDLARDLADSVMTYVVWWDTDGDGAFNAGDTYIDSSGAPQVWDGVSAISTHITTGIDVPASGTWTEPTAWTVNNTLFPNQGTYHVTATWTDSSGLLIDEETTDFFSIPAMGWPLLLLTGIAGALWMWRSRDAFGTEVAA